VDTEEIAFPGTGVQLSGSITCPAAGGAGPGVVLIAGSGPSDRHNDGFFDALRAHLASAGVVVLAYDKRGAGKSTGAWEHEPWYPLLSAGGFSLDPVTWAQLTAWADYDPRDDLTRLKTPTLAIFGENDRLVPVCASVQQYDQTAFGTGRYQQTLVFPGVGHRLQVTAGFAPGYLTRLSTWCLDREHHRSRGSTGQRHQDQAPSD
jgi:pimeloyl-ACP methyl ester carboxylesterase